MPALGALGTVNTLGAATIGQYLLSVNHNPAACMQVLQPEDFFRMGYLSSVSAVIEMGQVDNFERDINDLVDLLKKSDVNEESAEALSDRFNRMLVEAGQYGYLKANFEVSIPGLPMAIQSDAWVGGLCLEGVLSSQLKASVLADGLTFTSSKVNNTIIVDFSTDSSLLLKSAQLTRLAIDYALPVYPREQIAFSSGQLLAGARLNFYSMQLSRQLVLFERFENEDVMDVIQDEYDQSEQNNYGVDFGVSWVNKKYQLGLTLANLNEPSFNYTDFVNNCAQLSASTARNNCQAANNFIRKARINRKEKHVMSVQGTLDATYWIMSRWVVAGSYDLVELEDVMGDELQWMSIATAFVPMNRWMPGLRLGYRKNLVGESLASANVGATYFGVFNLDLMYGLDRVLVDGDQMPRMAGVHFGFEQKF
jgi:hypothetical protein